MGFIAHYFVAFLVDKWLPRALGQLAVPSPHLLTQGAGLYRDAKESVPNAECPPAQEEEECLKCTEPKASLSKLFQSLEDKIFLFFLQK